MPDMDGFKLLEIIGLEMDLPVISKPHTGYPRPSLFFPVLSLVFFFLWLAHQCRARCSWIAVISANADSSVVLRGVTHGAVDYLIKPVRIMELRNIWQHVIRKKYVPPKPGTDEDEEERCKKKRKEDDSHSSSRTDKVM